MHEFDKTSLAALPPFLAPAHWVSKPSDGLPLKDQFLLQPLSKGSPLACSHLTLQLAALSHHHSSDGCPHFPPFPELSAKPQVHRWLTHWFPKDFLCKMCSHYFGLRYSHNSFSPILKEYQFIFLPFSKLFCLMIVLVVKKKPYLNWYWSSFLAISV